MGHGGFDLQTLPVAAAREWRLSRGQVGKKQLVHSRELESIKKKKRWLLCWQKMGSPPASVSWV